MILRGKKVFNAFLLLALFGTSLLLSGCAAALIVGGVAGGYLIAQHVDIKPKDTDKPKINFFGK